MPDDPVNVERVGGTAATNPWHDHRVMLVSPVVNEVLILAATSLWPSDPRRIEAEQFIRDWRAAPRVHADDDAIRWLTNRQGDAT